MRLAGTLSFWRFCGNDPSRINQWIQLVPNPTPTQVVKVGVGRRELNAAAQGVVHGPQWTDRVRQQTGTSDAHPSIRQWSKTVENTKKAK